MTHMSHGHVRPDDSTPDHSDAVQVAPVAAPSAADRAPRAAGRALRATGLGVARLTVASLVAGAGLLAAPTLASTLGYGPTRGTSPVASRTDATAVDDVTAADDTDPTEAPAGQGVDDTASGATSPASSAPRRTPQPRPRVSDTPTSVAPEVSQQRLAALPASDAAATAPRTTADPLAQPHRGTAAERVVTATARASMVGVTWAHRDAPTAGTPLEVRGLRADRTWTGWAETEVQGIDDPTALATGRTTRAATDPVWLGPVTRVQVRYREGSTRIARGRLELIAPGTAAGDTVQRVPGSANAMAARPTIITRAQWGAKESLRRCDPSYGTTTNALVVHHTDGSNDYTASQSASIVRGIYAFHTVSRGWCDIGYNMLVDRFGQVFEGRYGGIDLPVIGAHALGFNTNTFGVSMMGTFTSRQPPQAAMDALRGVLAWRAAGFYRNAAGTTVLTSASSGSRYPSGTRVTLPFVIGHRDVYSTSCPGGALYALFSAVRSAVAAREGYTGSVIYQRWKAMGGASSTLGPVRRGETAVSFGRRTVFQKGWTMYAVGTATRLLTGPVDAAYRKAGGEAAWGRPTGDTRPVSGVSGVVSQAFSRGTAWGRSTTVRATLSRINTAYRGVDGPAGVLGMPTGEQRTTSSGGLVQAFAKGTITAPADTSRPAVVHVGGTTSEPTTTPTKVVLRGHGYGHGRGLGQWGALGYAVDHGWSHSSILSRFYGGTRAGRTDNPVIGVRLMSLEPHTSTWVTSTRPFTVGGRSIPAGHAGRMVWSSTRGAFQVDRKPYGCATSGTATRLGAALTRTATTSTGGTLVTCRTKRGYAGSLRWVRDGSATRLVNRVRLETYLRGVVPREMPASWGDAGSGRGMQALKAQAVAARSYVMAGSRWSYARTCDTTSCQVYGGRLQSGTVVTDPRTDRAILATAGQVRRSSATGAIAVTEFSSSTGGRSAGGTFPSVTDAGDTRSPYHDWTVTLSASTVASRYAVGTLRSVRVVSSSAGRATTVEIVGAKRSVRVSGDSMRWALGLRSTYFVPTTR